MYSEDIMDNKYIYTWMFKTCLSQTVDKVTVNFKTINKRIEKLYFIVKVIKTRVKFPSIKCFM